MLVKLLEGDIKVMERRNLVKSERFSDKLKKSLNKYRNQAISNAEVIEEIINIARDMERDSKEEKRLGLNDDEIAFYYALTKDDAVKKFMTDETLKKIAQDLTRTIRNSITVDWSQRESAKASMRTIIKRLLAKYGYPPKEARKALEIVMKQAEMTCGNFINDEVNYGMVAD